MNTLYKAIIDKVVEKTGADLKSNFEISKEMSEKIFVIPPNRTRYLSEISESNRAYDSKVDEQVLVAQKLYGIFKTIETIVDQELLLDKTGIDSESLSIVKSEDQAFLKLLNGQFDRVKMDLDPYNWEVITGWSEKVNKYKTPIYSFKVRDKEISIKTHSESLSHTQIPKVSLPKYSAWGDVLKWCLQENVPGEFPYASGLYPFKRTGEDPTRMFAGEGGPERTNKRFHYVVWECQQHVYQRHLIL